MFKDDSAGLEQIVGEACFKISWLMKAKARRVPESYIQPAANHYVSEQVDFLAEQILLSRLSFTVAASRGVIG